VRNLPADGRAGGPASGRGAAFAGWANREELGQIALAEERYRKVVVLDDRQPPSRSLGLSSCMPNPRRWADLAQVLERRITVPGGRLEGTEARQPRL